MDPNGKPQEPWADILHQIGALRRDNEAQLSRLAHAVKSASTSELVQNDKINVTIPEKASDAVNRDASEEMSSPKPALAVEDVQTDTLPPPKLATATPHIITTWTLDDGSTVDIPPFLLKNHRTAHFFEEKPELVLPDYKTKARYIVSSFLFEKGIGAVIVANAIMLGIETEDRVRGVAPPWPSWISYIFLLIYAAEIAVRIAAYDRELMWDGWFYFDAFLLFSLFLELGAGDEGGIMGQIVVIRTMRILRFVRALRVIKQFKMIWRLVRGLLHSMDVMASTTFLVALMLYIFACLGLEVIGGDEVLLDDEETKPVAQAFATVSMSMMTLIQFVTLDSVAGIYVPLVSKKPELMLYFLPIMLIVSIALMNLVTASIVDASLAYSQQERVEERNHVKQEILNSLPVLVKIFHDLDADKSGNVTLEEVEHLSMEVLPAVVRNNVPVDSLAELFEMIDVDGGGELTLEEFLDGLLELWLMDMPISTIQLIKMSRLTRRRVDDHFRALSDQLTEMKDQLEGSMVIQHGM
mmetsp:Transcript_52655/g.94511  ORF Transcript_52655/g.94511 Transcript_52655/m.94511 type:complete len:525 (+) Transcript_52655:60-1634(+)